MVSSYGPTSATREHEKRILETILPPDLRHLVHGNSSSALHVNTILAHLSGNRLNPKKNGSYIFYSFFFWMIISNLAKIDWHIKSSLKIPFLKMFYISPFKKRLYNEECVSEKSFSHIFLWKLSPKHYFEFKHNTSGRLKTAIFIHKKWTIW